MPKTSTASDAVEVLKAALATGGTVLLSLAAPPRVNSVPPLVSACRVQFGLTLAEALVFAELLEHGQAEQGVLQAAMSHNGDPVIPTTKSLGVIICKLRKKLPHDIQIVTVWGSGYALTENTRARARKLLAESAATPTAEAAAAPMD